MPAQARIHAPRRIAVLGAGRTGKSRLANELAAHLQAAGLHAVAVDPLAAAEDHERRVEAAAAGADIVIADTTALLIAIRAESQQENSSLVRFGLDRQRHYDATLLTGLDLSGVAAGSEALDALLRSSLQQAGIGFQVVYGQGPQRLQSALQALETAGVLPAGIAPRPDDAGALRNWVASCEKCSDPECEHRLFSRLRETRG